MDLRRLGPPSIALVVTLLLLSAATIAAPTPQGRDRVLVLLHEGASITDVTAGHDVTASRPLDQDTYLVETSDVRGIAAHPDVVSVERDDAVRAARASWDRASWDRASWDRASWDRASWDRASWDVRDDEGDLVSPRWGADAIQADPQAQTSATVCMVDSGIDGTHPQLAPNLWRGPEGNHGVDILRGDGTPDDEAGHGTHLAGIIAATPEGPMQGVSTARIASAKIFGADGIGFSSALIEGIAWCSAIDADVILLALTEDAPSRALKETIARAQREGSIIVASAGNGGPCSKCVSYPGAYERVIAVAAITHGLDAARYSSAGPRVDLAAPGDRILSTYPGGWRVGSGTSQAAAFAAGSLAALLSTQSAEEATSDLRRTAMDLDRAGKDDHIGHGLIQLQAALAGSRSKEN